MFHTTTLILIISLSIIPLTWVGKLILNQYDKYWNNLNPKLVQKYKEAYKNLPNVKVHFMGYTRLWNILTIIQYLSITVVGITLIVTVIKSIM